MECSDCGFGKPNGIPTDCKALEHSAGRLVEWIRFEDQTMPDGKVNKKQQIPVMGTLGELWEEFMTHTKKVSAAVRYRRVSQLVFLALPTAIALCFVSVRCKRACRTYGTFVR